MLITMLVVPLAKHLETIVLWSGVNVHMCSISIASCNGFKTQQKVKSVLWIAHNGKQPQLSFKYMYTFLFHWDNYFFRAWTMGHPTAHSFGYQLDIHSFSCNSKSLPLANLGSLSLKWNLYRLFRSALKIFKNHLEVCSTEENKADNLWREGRGEKGKEAEHWYASLRKRSFGQA